MRIAAVNITCAERQSAHPGARGRETVLCGIQFTGTGRPAARVIFIPTGLSHRLRKSGLIKIQESFYGISNEVFSKEHLSQKIWGSWKGDLSFWLRSTFVFLQADGSQSAGRCFWTSRTSLTWGLVRNASSRARPQARWVRNARAARGAFAKLENLWFRKTQSGCLSLYGSEKETGPRKEPQLLRFNHFSANLTLPRQCAKWTLFSK